MGSETGAPVNGQSSNVRLERAYDEPQDDDGHRVLVDRVWPRGKTKAELRLDAWAKDLGPSTELRKWFAHDPTRWINGLTFVERHLRGLAVLEQHEFGAQASDLRADAALDHGQHQIQPGEDAADADNAVAVDEDTVQVASTSGYRSRNSSAYIQLVVTGLPRINPASTNRKLPLQPVARMQPRSCCSRSQSPRNAYAVQFPGERLRRHHAETGEEHHGLRRQRS